MTKQSENQFGHVDTFARNPKAGKKGTKAKSVNEILGEAMRLPENCPHVPNPQPPVHVAGMTPEELSLNIDKLLDERKIEGKKKPRGDIHVLAGGVYSWPESVNDFDKVRFELWMKEQIEWHRENVGEVDCAVVHFDESYPHLHIYTVDPDARRLVPGHVAKREAEHLAAESGKSNKDICKLGNAAYKAAMTDWQDDLWQGVGKYHGLDRIGPRLQRIPPKDYAQEKKARFAASDGLRRLRDEIRDGEGRLIEIGVSIEQFEALKQENRQLKTENTALKSEVLILTKEANVAEQGLVTEQAKTSALEAQIATLASKTTITPAEPLLKPVEPSLDDLLKIDSTRSTTSVLSSMDSFKRDPFKP